MVLLSYVKRLRSSTLSKIVEENKEFVVFILTHGRPQKVVTVNALKKAGYTGKTYFIIDNEDKTAEQYVQLYGKDNVIVFNKKEIADTIDEGNNFDDRRATVHARNASFKIAESLGVKYFILLEDDYENFEYRYPSSDGQKLMGVDIDNLDKVFELHLEFFKSSTFTSIALAQNGDYIGGIENANATTKRLLRKCMNSFFCSTDRPFRFVGQFNDDVNTYVTLGSRGNLFATIPMISLRQTPTQKTKSGMTEVYLKYGTYCKSFTTVMMHPSGVRVAILNSSNPRIHHSIKWINTVPVIVDEKYKKNKFDLSWFIRNNKSPQNMPVGEDGKTIWNRSKQTSEGLLECVKRGAGLEEQPKTIPCIKPDSK